MKAKEEQQLTSRKRINLILTRLRLFASLTSLFFPIIASGLQYVFWEQIKPHIWYLFYPAVFLSAGFGGWQSGISSTSISVLLGLYCFNPAGITLAHMDSDQISSLTLFVMMGIVFSIFNGRFSTMLSTCGNLLLSLINANENMLRINDQLRETTETLRRNEERLNLATSGTDVGVWEWDLQSDIVHCSDSFKRQLGFDGEDFPVTAKEMHQFLDPDSGHKLVSELQTFLHGTTNHYQSEVRLRARDHSYRWFMIRGYLQRNTNGDPIRMTGVRLDITQQKSAEEKFSGLLESTPDPILVCNNRGEFVFVNKQFESKFGYSRDELIGKTLEMVLPEALLKKHEELRKKYFQKPYLRFMGQGRELIGRRKDGSEFPIEVSLGPFNTNEGYLVTAAIRDTTERVKIERQLLEAKEAAVRANEAKSFFLANMSHEIRTPISVMMGYAELIANSSTTADVLSYANAIQHNGWILINLINDILDLSKVEAGKLEVRPNWINLDKFFSDVITHLRVRANEKSIALNLIYDAPVPESAFVDDFRFRQVLINIIGNAIKFTNRGEVNVRVALNETNEKPLLEVDIKDTGPGIADENVTKIFEPFTQASTSVCHSYGGTGLGLSLSKNLAKALGGDLYLKSSILGSGSTFTVTIDPGNLENVHRVSEAQLNRAVEIPKSVDKSNMHDVLRDVRVLIVEDAGDLQLLMLKFLETSGALIEVVSNGKQAIDKINSTPFDIVLMDIQMPVMNGYEAASYLRAVNYKQPIIALTANAMTDEIDKCFKCGFSAYLSKPVTHQKLIETIIYHLKSHPTSDLTHETNITPVKPPSRNIVNDSKTTSWSDHL